MVNEAEEYGAMTTRVELHLSSQFLADKVWAEVRIGAIDCERFSVTEEFVVSSVCFLI